MHAPLIHVFTVLQNVHRSSNVMLSGNFCAELAETNQKAEKQLVNKWYFFPILCPYVTTSSLTYAQASNFWNCDFMFSFEVLIIALRNHCVKSVQIRNYFWSVFSCIQNESRSTYNTIFVQVVMLCYSVIFAQNW